MKVVTRIYVLDGENIPVTITFKRVRNLILRYNSKSESFSASAPLFTPISSVDKFLFKALAKMKKKVKKKPLPYEDGKLFLLGEIKEVGELEEGEIDAYYKKVGLPYLKQRVAFFEQQMGVKPPYQVRMRKMANTFGSNSKKTHRLSFQTRLLAYSPEVIDSVIVHELAHHFHFDHSPKFYKVVYAHCPDYDKWRKKLIHHEYAR